MSLLFAKNVMTINEHINNVYKEGELNETSTIRKSLIVQKEGKRNIKREILFYNLDVVISVGYRVKSKQGTQFRIWATNVLKDYLLKGYALNQRMNRIENNFENLNEKIDAIALHIQSNQLPKQGIFFDGQVFDSYEFTSKIIRSAHKSIVLIDNYMDESTFVHLSKKKKGVQATLLCKNVNKQLKLDIQKANEQYGNFEQKTFGKSHDRFLIIDNSEDYHLGASLKDLGKKWFAFSKMDKTSVQYILDRISNLT